MNFIGFMFVCERKESDCIIIEIPLKEIIAEIKERESGVMLEDSIFTPFVISMMPDITPWKSAVFSGLKLKIDGIKEKTWRFVKSVIINEKSAI